MANTQELLERYRAVMPSFVNPLYESPISIDYGEGSYVWDLEGNRYLDFFGGILTTMIGHSVPEVVSAVQDQALGDAHIYVVPQRTSRVVCRRSSSDFRHSRRTSPIYDIRL